MSKMGRRLCAIAIAVALILPASASGETAAQLKARLDDLKSRARKAGDAYSQAHWKLDETEVALDRTEQRIEKTEKRLAAAKRRLNYRVNGMYRGDQASVLFLLVGAQSFEQFVTRMDFLSRVGSADADAIADVKRLRTELYSSRRALLKQRKTRAADEKRLRARADKLEGRLSSLEAEFRQVKLRLDAVRSGGSRPSGVAAMPGPNGMVFPVVGSYYYADTWGASRSGGRRRHKGTDIMAPHGTPCVAVLSGTVSSKDGGLGGRTIWLTSDSGWSFYYAHLQDWAVRSGRVQAGQVIGYVGSTGNATSSAPHLHFQMHPGGGEPVNPYPYLRAME